MRLLADLHIAPRTVQFLRTLGHDILRVTDLLPATASDETIVECAAQEQRIILTQDLDMTAIIALSRRQYPSLVTLRLSSVRIEFVNTVLHRTLPVLEQDLLQGALVTIEDSRVRLRRLPLTIQDNPPR
jgi:predicted nuclease of predicted toxin-antitoxin system